MVSVPYTLNGTEKSFYMDNRLYTESTTIIRKGIQKKDKDWLVIIDGQEGSGKSVFAMLLGKVLDPDLNMSRICMTPQDFTKAILTAKKGQCVIFDEAFTGLSSRGALTEINRVLVSLMMEMRQKNLYVLIVMPTFFELDRYVAIHRSKGLFHVYQNSGRRGFFTYFNEKNKKLLYLKGKKMYDYSYPRTGYYGRFLDQYIIPEQEYRDKKKEALMKKSRSTRAMQLKSQRDTLMYIMYKTLDVSQRRISQLMRENHERIDHATISEALKEKARDLSLMDELTEPQPAPEPTPP